MRNQSGWRIGHLAPQLLSLRTRRDLTMLYGILSAHPWMSKEIKLFSYTAERFRCPEPQVESFDPPPHFCLVSWRGCDEYVPVTCAWGRRRLGLALVPCLGRPLRLRDVAVHHQEKVATNLISASAFPDACPPPLFFHSFVHTFLKYLPNTYFRHKPGLARAGVYRRRLFSPLPLNGSSLLLSLPIIQVVTGVDGGISKIHPCWRHPCQEFPATPWGELQIDENPAGTHKGVEGSGGERKPAVRLSAQAQAISLIYQAFALCQALVVPSLLPHSTFQPKR